MFKRAVRDWLVLLTMEKYIDNFLDRGYDCIAHCKLIVSSDLIMLGVDNASHRKLLLDGVQFLINSPEFTCSEPSAIEEENPAGGVAATKYSDRFNFLDSPKRVEEEPSGKRLYKMSPQSVNLDLNDLTKSARKSKRFKSRRVLDMKSEENANYTLID